MFTCVFGRHAASTVLLVSKLFGGRQPWTYIGPWRQQRRWLDSYAEIKTAQDGHHDSHTVPEL